MQRLICGSLSIFILTTASAAIAAPIDYAQIDAKPPVRAVINYQVPHITNSGVRNNTHFIRVAVVGMSLEDLMISIPSQMERFNGVRIRDKFGKDIAAQIDVGKEIVSINFNEPVNPGESVEVLFTGVKTRVPLEKILLYGVMAKRVGLDGEIPVGTARIDLPDKN